VLHAVIRATAALETEKESENGVRRERQQPAEGRFEEKDKSSPWLQVFDGV
jgi:hypothetical protein